MDNMECIYRRFDPAFWAAPVIAVIIIVAVFFVIVLFSLKERKKQAQNWFVYLFAMILPSFLLVFVTYATILESRHFNKFTSGDFSSIKGAFNLESVEYDRIGRAYYSFSIGDYIFSNVCGDEGAIIGKIENGCIIEVHFILDENNIIDGEQLVIVEILKETTLSNVSSNEYN